MRRLLASRNSGAVLPGTSQASSSTANDANDSSDSREGAARPFSAWPTADHIIGASDDSDNVTLASFSTAPPSYTSVQWTPDDPHENDDLTQLSASPRPLNLPPPRTTTPSPRPTLRQQGSGSTSSSNDSRTTTRNDIGTLSSTYAIMESDLQVPNGSTSGSASRAPSYRPSATENSQSGLYSRSRGGSSVDLNGGGANTGGASSTSLAVPGPTSHGRSRSSSHVESLRSEAGEGSSPRESGNRSTGGVVGLRALVPSTSEVVLAWTPPRSSSDPPENRGETSTLHGGGTADALPDYSITGARLPTYRPPIPTSPRTFTFSPFSASPSSPTPNAMLVLPSADSQETRPLYHISVSQNCWAPMSFITTVRRGGRVDGDFVGDFEMGVTARMSTVCIGETQTFVSKALKGRSSPWKWEFEDTKLQWILLPKNQNRESRKKDEHLKCFLVDSARTPSIHLANFTRHELNSLRNRRKDEQASELHVLPDAMRDWQVSETGEEFSKTVDHIVMSVLIMERIRFTA
ncbi:uncharacterized protein STEHIDRAFT_171535 [Stereum hirsutum FP-91666 SS1]|uniref:uncharacterized protein n=1 Tax=Stereum hirsutum (strain FP-91666) TaxID=721885 RepID=UPI000444932D|nr:uncharacterized protein STEHIDRAFT_171535 [Stereum hirsutum FP-91666 SS1]EIM81896.1 hypothetical protein STEHIDRAFT_171535 [Stereum hirsutum FP-91666 SS1]